MSTMPTWSLPTKLQAWARRHMNRLVNQWRLRHTPGRQGEKLAGKHLKKLGYQILATNLQCGQYEIDILARTPDGSSLVVVEVKTVIHSNPAKPPELRADHHKWMRLHTAAHYLIKRYKIQNPQVRFDLIAVELPPHAPPTLRHIPAAWQMGQKTR